MSFQCERCGKVTDKITYKIVKTEPKEVKGLCSYCEMETLWEIKRTNKGPIPEPNLQSQELRMKRAKRIY